MQLSIIAQNFCHKFFFEIAGKSVKTAMTDVIRARHPALSPKGDCDRTRYIYSNCLCIL